MQVALIGYSMGGNLVLKLAGEWGAAPPLCAVAAVCPAIDLAAGSDALHEPVNRLYERRFLRGLMRRFRRKAALYPKFTIYLASALSAPCATSTTQSSHATAAFATQTTTTIVPPSARVVDRIAVPTLILRALDDPFIRLVPETRAKLLANPNVTLIETEHGGHCAYLSGDTGDDIHWAEATVIRYLRYVSAANQEADWELELGSGAPVIDGAWPGLLTCASFRTAVQRSKKTRLLPALGDALIRLNAHSSPVWTAKCDVWIVQEPIDPYELDCTAAEHSSDDRLLHRSAAAERPAVERSAASCQPTARRFANVCEPYRCAVAVQTWSCAELISHQMSAILALRHISPVAGESEDGARQQLAMVLAAFADTLLPVAAPTRTVSPLQ